MKAKEEEQKRVEPSTPNEKTPERTLLTTPDSRTMQSLTEYNKRETRLLLPGEGGVNRRGRNI